MMMNEIVEISPLHLLAAYIFTLIVLALVRRRELGKETEIILATVRMTIQLIIVGYILDYVFGQSSVLFTFIIFAVMEVFAIQNIFGRLKSVIRPELKPIIAVSILVSTSLSIFYFLIIVVHRDPWYDPQYFIPITGMIVGNSMNGIALGTERMISGIRSNVERVEGALMLGATPSIAVKSYVKDAFGAAIMPTINSMMTMGIVSLPGMMTGQILSGTSPLVAIRYQIAIMLGISGSVTLSVFLVTELGYRVFFTNQIQLSVNNE